MGDSRVAFFEQTLQHLGYYQALEALDWLKDEMCAEKGYKRHNGAHYYYHPIDCAQDLLNHGIREEAVIITALLHDIVEDVPGITVKMVEHKFGTRVSIAVDLLTKQEGIDYKIPENLREYLAAILKNRDAALVKTADRKHNFSTLIDASFEKQLKQALETRDYFIPFFKDCRKLYGRYSAYFFSAKTSTEPLIWHILKHHQDVAALNHSITEMQAAWDADMKSIKGC